MEEPSENNLDEQTKEDTESKEKPGKGILSDYPSAKLLLTIVQKEYEFEANRMKNLEARTGMFIAFSGALLVFIANNINKFVKFDMSKLVTIAQAFPYWTYLICVLVTLSSLLFSIYSFIRVISIAEYMRLDVDDFPVNTIYNEEVIAKSVMELYCSVISDNMAVTNNKIEHFKRGIYAIQLALVFNVIAYISALFIA